MDVNATLDQMNAVLNKCDENSPYLPENERAYSDWREHKLELRRRGDPVRAFRLNAEGLLPQAELRAAQRQIEAFNFILFEATASDFGKHEFIALNRQFGLCHLDSNPGADDDQVTSLRVLASTDERAQYIPYTNRAMNWHTDGYYNPPDRRVNAFALYCVQPAARGGANYLFDHEMMYLLIRDQSPEMLAALMAEDLMRIPANVQGNRVVRAEESGPVFSLQGPGGVLNMRYTSRPRNIVWKDDQRSRQALDRVREILMEGSCLIELQLREGQGVICNNLLHGREAFHDNPQHPARLVYRARYYDSIDLRAPCAVEARA
jgi:alpha-ketoglutarate-dependent taurine dioxygenase